MTNKTSLDMERPYAILMGILLTANAIFWPITCSRNCKEEFKKSRVQLEVIDSVFNKKIDSLYTNHQIQRDSIINEAKHDTNDLSNIVETDINFIFIPDVGAIPTLYSHYNIPNLDRVDSIYLSKRDSIDKTYSMQRDFIIKAYHGGKTK